MKRSEAVLQGAPLVFALEEAAMDAVRAAATTTIGLIDLRRDANLNATVGAEAWEHLIATTSHMQAGLRSTLAFHQEMRAVQVRMGCSRIVANGGGEKNPHDPMDEVFTPSGASTPDHLRLVG